MATSVIGGMQQAKAQKAQGKAEQQAAEYQARVAENNRIIAQRNIEASERAAQAAERSGKEAEAIGRQQAQLQRDQASKLIGRQRAVLAANGVDVNEGSAVDIQAETRGFGELDALTTLANAGRERVAYQEQAGNYRTQGENFGTEAQNFAIEAEAQRARGLYARKAGNAAAQSTLISTAGSVASKWYGFSSQGTF